MTTTTPDRLPTTRDLDGHGYVIPLYPLDGFFEEAKARTGLTGIEEIMAREPWSYDAANERVIGQMLDDGWMPNVAGVLVAPEPPKDRTKSGPTPSRKQARRSGKTAAGEAETGFRQRGSEGGCYS